MFLPISLILPGPSNLIYSEHFVSRAMCTYHLENGCRYRNFAKKYPKKDLRPNFLTASISNVAEGFIVADYVKAAVLKVIDPNWYAAIPKSSTTIALQ